MNIRTPELADLEHFLPFSGPISSGQTYSKVVLHQVDLTGSRGPDLRFEEALFASTALRSSVWRGLCLVDARLKGCDVSNADWQQGRFHRAEFESCNLTGINLSQAHMNSTRFDGSKILLAHFSQAKLVACAFRGCNLEQADFSGADLRQVVFERGNLTGARFFGANLEGTDLRTSNLTELGVTTRDLRGAIVDAAQAVGLASLLGVIVK